MPTPYSHPCTTHTRSTHPCTTDPTAANSMALFSRLHSIPRQQIE